MDGSNDIPGFGAAVAARRAKLGLTQAQLAEACGAHPVTVAKVERGMRMPSLAGALRLARALRTTVDALAGEAAKLARTAAG